MKKSAVFLFLSLLALGFFACQFTEPTAIEIIGSPSIRFAETVDIGKMFTDLLDEAVKKDERVSVFPCKQTIDLTYLIYMDLFNKDFEAIEHEDEIGNLSQFFPGMELVPKDIGITLPSNKTLIDGSDERMVIPLSEIGSLLEGFEFSEYKIKLYFSGSSLISKAKVDIKIEEVDIVNDIEEYTEIGNKKNVDTQNKGSNIEDWKTNDEYNGTSCPSDGVEINIPIKGKDIAVSFKVYIPAGETLSLNDFEAGNIKIEVVVWLPFVFTAGDDGAELKFPEDSFFSVEDDLFGREEAGDNSIMTDIVESLSVNVKFQNNPFNGADLIISSKGIEIHNLINNNALSFTLTEDDMKKINASENFPFTPELKVSFSSGCTVRFPRIFNATEFGFKAKVRYRIDLQ